MSAICKSLQIDMCFADYKATIGPRIGQKTPDLVCMTIAGNLRIVGEIKVPWIKEHDIAAALEDVFPCKVSRLFGQIAQYMKLANLRYVFLTTYERTVFSRQVVSNGRWVLQCSEPIKGSTASKDPLMGTSKIEFPYRSASCT
ncbi:hypothetical protein BDV40DRAFT_298107 [Aspergillus tamarii]|uniref:Fungal-type protein kinase domain-containing protein n=1 Tax=Aspergillus tamarii TaxID=41984 RepID=A0A5N6V1G2_ASPTM|nr:hypothetical protein BDV40DRAFT_298107 [Aspergillus tamarii]